MKTIVKVTYINTKKVVVDVPEYFVKILNGTLDTSDLNDNEQDTLYDLVDEHIQKIIAKDHPNWDILTVDID